MRKLSIIVIAVAISLIGTYYLIGSLIPGPRGMDARDKAVDVIVTDIKVRPVTMYKELPARIRSTRTSEVRPQLSGIILKRHFTEGSFVKKGQALYQIDPAPYFIEFNQAKSEVGAAKIDLKAKKDNLNRYKTLFEIDAVSKAGLDSVSILFEKSKADLAVKKASLDKARIRLNYTKVLAPIDGKIGKSYVTQGALVKDMQDEPLAIITNLDSVYADISQPSTQIKEIQGALMNNDEIEVELFSPDSQKKPINKGILQFSEAIIEESTGSVLMRAKFDNKDHALLPGLFVEARLNLGKKDVLTIEQSAVIINPDGTMTAYLVGDDNIVNPKVIEIDGRYKNYWIVKSGLQRGDLVVKEGLQKIRPDSRINPSLPNEQITNMTNKSEKPANDTANNDTGNKNISLQDDNLEKSTANPAAETTIAEEFIAENAAITPKTPLVVFTPTARAIDASTVTNNTATKSLVDKNSANPSFAATGDLKTEEAGFSEETKKKISANKSEKMTKRLKEISETTDIYALEEKIAETREDTNEIYRAKISEFIDKKLSEAQKNVLDGGNSKSDKNIKNSNILSNIDVGMKNSKNVSASNIKKQEG